MLLQWDLYARLKRIKQFTAGSWTSCGRKGMASLDAGGAGGRGEAALNLHRRQPDHPIYGGGVGPVGADGADRVRAAVLQIPHVPAAAQRLDTGGGQDCPPPPRRDGCKLPWKWQGEKGPCGNVKRDPSVGRSTSPGSFRIRRAVHLVGGPTPPRVVRTLLPEAQEPCRVHTTPISLGIPTRRRYGIRP